MLNRDQQRTARAIGGYGVLRLLANPDNGWQGGEYGGGSGAHGWTPRHWTEYGTKGAKILSPFPEHVPVAEVTWKAVAEHARRLPADLRERITAALSAAQEHRRDYPPTYPSLGRPYAWDMPPPPGTPEQHEKDHADIAAFYAERTQREKAWHAVSQQHREQQDALLDEAFPLAAEAPEPTDLLELLAAQGGDS